MVCSKQTMLREVPRFFCSVHAISSHVPEYQDAAREKIRSVLWCYLSFWNSHSYFLHTKNPDVLSKRQRNRTVKLRSRWWILSGASASANGRPDNSAGRNEFHMSWRCSSSRSSECTSSYTDWCTMSDYRKLNKYEKIASLGPKKWSICFVAVEWMLSLLWTLRSKKVWNLTHSKMCSMNSMRSSAQSKIFLISFMLGAYKWLYTQSNSLPRTGSIKWK